jgi:hypothetical protein
MQRVVLMCQQVKLSLWVGGREGEEEKMGKERRRSEWWGWGGGGEREREREREWKKGWVGRRRRI